jgi:MFS family permease
VIPNDVARRRRGDERVAGHRTLVNGEEPTWRREAWFGSYLFVGFAQNGLAPILLPLASKGGAESGLSYASFALTGLAAPVLGSWAGRTGRHRDLLVWGCFGAAACFLVICLVCGGPAIIALTGGAGLGVTAATTAANVLVIQGVDECRWDERVADLRRIVSAGQVLGLLLAGGLAATHMRLALLFAAMALIVAAVLATYSAPRSSVQESTVRPPLGRYRGRSSAARPAFRPPAQRPPFRPRRAW